jgi:DNA repair protein RecN (Recombination protein N)
MLEELRIQNFAIIEELILTPAAGLNVLTGETGAGKSIVIDALGFVLGMRAGPSIIRAGARSCHVEASFSRPPREVRDRLDALEIALEDDLVTVARDINTAGRNSYRLNGTLVSLAVLREVGEWLVEIHGQHEQQGLLVPARHVDLLDRLGGPELLTQRAEVETLYQRWRSLCAERERLLADDRDRERRREWLTFEIDEIAAAGLSSNGTSKRRDSEPGDSPHGDSHPGTDPQPESPDDELTALENERAVLTHADKLRHRTAEALAALDEGEASGSHGQTSARDQLSQAARALSAVASLDTRLAPLLSSLEGVAAGLDDVCRDLRQYADTIDIDPQRLEAVNERLATLARLQKKYGPTLADVVAYAERARAELATLDASETRLGELTTAIGSTTSQLSASASALSRQRRAVADRIEGQVAEELRGLEMPHTRFAVRITHEPDDQQANRFFSNGIDRVEFLIAPNPGQPLQPLAKIASGGEMSRFLLAVHAVLAAASDDGSGAAPLTMIFDEVDAGLGGVAAEAVAARLSRIGEHRQVLCITHLPMVAAAATSHFSLRKAVEGDSTRTHVKLLEPDERVPEIARMLAGNQVSETTLRQAREMMSRSASPRGESSGSGPRGTQPPVRASGPAAVGRPRK